MKTLFWGTVVAGWLILAVGEVRGAAMQFGGTGGFQQFSASPGMVTQAPVFGGHSSGFQGQGLSGSQFSQSGHSLVHTEQASNQGQGFHQGNFHSTPGFVHQSGFTRNRFGQCRRSILVFVNGSPFWYSAYTAYPYYYGVAPLLASDSAVYTTDNESTQPADSNAANPANAQPPSQYADLGMSWGQDLRRDIVSWDQFVDYLKAYIIVAPPAEQAEFREAFINAYRINGAAAYDKGAVEASGTPLPAASGPKIITMPPAGG